jgi:hypothetical protein
VRAALVDCGARPLCSHSEQRHGQRQPHRHAAALALPRLLEQDLVHTGNDSHSGPLLRLLSHPWAALVQHVPCHRQLGHPGWWQVRQQVALSAWLVTRPRRAQGAAVTHLTTCILRPATQVHRHIGWLAEVLLVAIRHQKPSVRCCSVSVQDGCSHLAYSEGALPGALPMVLLAAPAAAISAAPPVVRLLLSGRPGVLGGGPVDTQRQQSDICRRCQAGGVLASG